MARPLTLETIFTLVDRISGPIKTMKGNTFKFSKETNDAFKRVGKFAKAAGVAAVAGAGLAGKALYDFAGRGDDIARNAKILGLSASAYQELGYAAKMADIDQDSFTSATKKLNTNLGQLRIGQGSLFTQLSKTNPALARQLRHTKDTNEAFDLMAGAISRETNVQKRAALAVAAFGKSGQDMIPMMEDLAAMRKEAQNSGAIITDKDVAAASRLDDSIKRIKAAGIGSLNSVLGGLADKLAPIVERMTAWIMANRDMIATRIEGVLNGVGRALDIVTRPGVIQGLAALAIGIKAVSLATMVMGAGNPWVLAIAGIAALITLIVANWDKITGFFDKLGAGASAASAMTAPQYQTARGGTNYTQEQSYRLGYGGVPLAPASSYSESVARSAVDINFANLPAGASVAQRGSAPGVAINTGNTLSRENAYRMGGQ